MHLMYVYELLLCTEEGRFRGKTGSSDQALIWDVSDDGGLSWDLA
jgi:hypothetical protein